jgi:glyceraldehyde 3-phosphate dehydrogenase
MSTRIGINGFGRIGRLALRAAWGWPELVFAHINEFKGDAATSTYSPPPPAPRIVSRRW